MTRYQLKEKLILPFRSRVILTVLWVTVCVLSLVISGMLVKSLRDKESYYVSLWSYAMGRLGDFNETDPLVNEIISARNTIPVIITNDRLQVEHYHLVPDAVIDNPTLLREKIEEFSNTNTPITINAWDGRKHHVFFGESRVLKTLKFFPVVEMLIFALLMALGLFAFQSSKDNEQNRVWVGLAKETAHQLGTPTSSLLGWIEYLRSQPIDQSAVEEMSKDLTHLLKIVDRFSKIGSETELSPANINEVVGESVMYFRTRVPRNVSIDYNGLAMAPVQAMINSALFEWVVENLLKNSLDALQGKGSIIVNISTSDDWVYIDVSDTGKGIAKSNFKKIFEPGFTTKTRGWGLGLSLSRRIIEDYHRGKIFVLDSELGRGTTFRIQIKRLYA